MTSPTIWNRAPDEDEDQPTIIVAVDPPENVPVGTGWADFLGAGFVEPDGTRS